MSSEQREQSPFTSKGVATEEMNGIINEMDRYEGWSSPGVKHLVLCMARHLSRWVSEHGLTLSELQLSHVRDFYMERLKSVRHSKSARYPMKLVFRYLRKTSRVTLDLDSVFALNMPKRRRLLPAMDPGVIANVLDGIDRSTANGKRDYAFILIGVTTGLRISDISSMRLADVDWRCGEIRLVQRKTGVPVSVPLTVGCGEALTDYLLNGRGASESDRIFVSADNQRPVSSGYMSGVFAKRCRQAGVDRRRGDGLSFHSLRRSVGMRLVSAGVSLPTVSQVLGHRSLESAERYICLGVESLKTCALDFSVVGDGGALWK